jgi:hypothetical protein
MSYSGRTTRTGNSKAFRFESALFTSHPEFAEGELEADVIAPGRLLIRTRSDEDEAKEDPVFDAYLAFVEEQMVTHPDLILSFTTEDIGGLDELLDGVEYDREEVLDEGFELP